MATPTQQEIEAVWDAHHVYRIPGHDMTNECRLAAVLIAERAERAQARTSPGKLSRRMDDSLSHHVPPAERLPRIERLRVAAKAYAHAIEAEIHGATWNEKIRLPDDAERAEARREKALERVEESLMWSVKALALLPA